MNKLLKHGLLGLSIAAFAGITLVAHDAQAARVGGGKSSGKQSSNVTQNQAPAAPAAAPAKAGSATPAAPAAAPAPARNKWLGPLAGLAAGLGIAALLSSLGLGGAMAEMLGSFLMIAGLALAAFFVWRMWKSRSGAPADAAAQPALAGAGADAAAATSAAPAYNAAPVATPVVAPAAAFTAQNSGAAPFVSAAAATGSAAGAAGAAGAAATSAFSPAATETVAAAATSGTWTIPAGFDVDDFNHIAKMYFVRLQAAWDARNESDIRTFTTPEMFAEIKLDLVARGDAHNQTDVVSLDALMLGVEEQGEKTLASVRLSGMIRETVGGPAEPFSEVWNLEKPASARASWVLAGIQQE